MPAVTQRPPGRTPSIGTTEQIRDVNLSRVLDLLHRDGALTRAELTRATGLNRSTIGVIVAELVGMGVVSETQSAPSGTGRPSPTITLDPGLVALAVNPEVGMLRLAVVGTGGRILARVSVPLDERPSAVSVARLAAAVAEGILGGHPEWRLLGAGIAVPGQVRMSDGSVSEATHLGWSAEPIAALMTSALGTPSWAANAAILAMRAENTFGAGRGLDDVFYVIGGPSGIGGGAVGEGRMIVGTAGYAGEIGHVPVRPGGSPCHCGAAGCFEAEVSESRMRAALGSELVGEALLEEWARRADERAVRELNEEFRGYFRSALRTVVNLFNPSTIVVAGFLATLIGDRGVEALVPDAIRASREGLRIVRAVTPDAVLTGAAELVISEFIQAPSARA